MCRVDCPHGGRTPLCGTTISRTTFSAGAPRTLVQGEARVRWALQTPRAHQALWIHHTVSTGRPGSEMLAKLPPTRLHEAAFPRPTH